MNKVKNALSVKDVRLILALIGATIIMALSSFAVHAATYTWGNSHGRIEFKGATSSEDVIFDASDIEKIYNVTR